MHGFLENWSVEDLDHVGDAYYGHYDSFRDFAENLAHETIEGLDGDSTLARYFDYEALSVICLMTSMKLKAKMVNYYF